MFVTQLPQSNTTWPNAIHQAKNYALAYGINAFAFSLFLGASGVTLWSGAAALLFAEKKVLDTMTHQISKLLVPIQTAFNFAQNFLDAAWNRTLLSKKIIDVIKGAASLVLPLDNAPHYPLEDPQPPKNPSETARANHPNDAPKIAPEVAQKGAPEVTPKVVQKVTPKVAQKVAQKVAPEVAQKVAPEVAQKGAQNPQNTESQANQRRRPFLRSHL